MTAYDLEQSFYRVEIIALRDLLFVCKDILANTCNVFRTV